MSTRPEPTSSTCTFTSERGHELSARLERPAGEMRGAAVFAHCFTCSKDLRVERQLTRALTEQGLAVLSFDFTGLGDSDGEFAESTFSADVADLRAAVRYLADTAVSPSLLIGHSLGGAAVLSAARDLPDVRAVATIAAPSDPSHVLHLLEGEVDAIRRDGSALVTIGGRQFTVGRSFVEDLETASPEQRIGGFTGATMIMHSPRDEVVELDNAERLYLAARHPKSFVSLDDADHLLTDAADATYAATVIAAWAGRYLPGRPAPVEAPGPVDGSRHAYDAAGVTARNEGGFATRLRSRGFVLSADEPLGSGGTETGPTPYDFLGMALASCTVMTMRMYADRKGWTVDGLDAEVHHSRVHADDCRDCEHTSGRIDRLDRTLRFPEGLSEEQRQRMLRIADRCPVHRTLEGQIEVHTQVDAP